MQRLSLNGAEFEYETVGSGEPLVLIHGSITAETWHCLLAEPALTDRYTVTHYYRRGFLGSTPHDGPFSIVQQAEDARAVIEAVARGRAHVAGHSYGGVTLLQLAHDAPEAVHTLALLEPPVPAPGVEELVGKILATAEMYSAGDAEGALDAFLDLVLGPGEYRDVVAEHMPAGWRQRALADLGTFYEVEFPAHGEWQFTAEMASRIDQPVLSVLGGISDPFFASADALIRQWLPQAETFVVPNASHGLHYMNPQGFISGLVAFLEKHPMRVPVPA